ncbi:MAG: adenosylmethionine--8-amino-7-oxononanoate transaminase [Gammaproteobacteria bacterium]|nr:adenosylmethionine--8-amino-7-oxononanoate transaminase [Gammaproteobacteria bacterium]
MNQPSTHLWHPCSQMKDYEIFKPLCIKQARGSYIELTDGKKIIDAISSWWCKSLGHNHPRLKAALLNQLDYFEHVILANTTNELIVNLSTQLAQLMSTLKKVFYASDGSCAVEIALKMSLHARFILGDSKRTQFIALRNSYHGETIGALSVSDLGMYQAPYSPLLFKTHYITPVYVSGINDPLWHDCGAYWEDIELQLAPFCKIATALIVEPIVQAAGNMKIYSQDFLKRLRLWTEQHHVHLIADEIMTGLGRTGKMLACEHANIEPDFLCLGKNLTSGWLPLSAVLTRDDIYYLFYDDYQTGKAFLHSHTFSGNALAASVALAALQVLKDESIINHTHHLQLAMNTAMHEVAKITQCITGMRGIGAMVAAELNTHETRSRVGFEITRKASELGALIRPLGRTLYWTPPLNTPIATIETLKQITIEAIQHVYF